MQDDWNNHLNKSLEAKNAAIVQLEAKLKQAEQESERELAELKEKLALADCRNMEKECELLSLGNKLKKS